MLILQRKKGEAVILSGDIKISVQETGADWVKLAIEAPQDVTILRSELVEAAEANQEAAASKDALMKLKKLL